jgi:hypothetical protein
MSEHQGVVRQKLLAEAAAQLGDGARIGDRENYLHC